MRRTGLLRDLPTVLASRRRTVRPIPERHRAEPGGPRPAPVRSRHHLQALGETRMQARGFRRFSANAHPPHPVRSSGQPDDAGVGPRRQSGHENAQGQHSHHPRQAASSRARDRPATEDHFARRLRHVPRRSDQPQRRTTHSDSRGRAGRDRGAASADTSTRRQPIRTRRG